MIISQIIGGLGNQMFQYAAGRALSIRHGVPLHLDITGFKGYNLHQGFELNKVFSCHVLLIDKEGIREYLGWQSSCLARKLLFRPGLKKFINSRFVFEPYFHYWKGFKELSSTSYLMGYWQSEIYFNEIADIIRQDFIFKEPISGCNLSLAEKINVNNSVSLHVRRGDYVENPKTNEWHGTCSIEYYNAAISYICDRFESLHFFIFSDDIEWVRANLKIPSPNTYVDHNKGQESYNDMRLMSLCKHNIIANSTFSWWGAWLNSNHDKIVIAPNRWFNSAQHDTRDLYCPGWVVL